MQRRYASAVTAALAVIGLIGWLLDWYARGKAAAELYNLTVANVRIPINWGAIYFDSFIIASFLLVAINWDWLAAIWLSKRQEKHRTWDEALTRAADHIALRSNTANSFKESTRFDEGVQMIEDFARAGKITIAGRVPESGLLKTVTRKMWAVATLEFRTTNRNLVDIWLAARDNPKTVLMRGLMVDYSQIHSEIP